HRPPATCVGFDRPVAPIRRRDRHRSASRSDPRRSVRRHRRAAVTRPARRTRAAGNGAHGGHDRGAVRRRRHRHVPRRCACHRHLETAGGPMTLTLLIGGARAGKSDLAVRIARSWNTHVTFVATAEAWDDEMAERIRRHQANRPPDWTTLEAPRHLDRALADVPADSGVVIDCLTLWVNNVMVDK